MLLRILAHIDQQLLNAFGQTMTLAFEPIGMQFGAQQGHKASPAQSAGGGGLAQSAEGLITERAFRGLTQFDGQDCWVVWYGKVM